MSTTADWINEIDPNAPDGATQRVSVLDDYVRMLSRVLRQTFPNFTGEAIEATEADLSATAGAAAAGGIQFKGQRGQADGYAALDGGGLVPLAQLPFGDGGFPAGTRLLFQQTTAPAGWTKETDADYNNKALRLTTGTNMSGGTMAFGALFNNTNQSGVPSATTGVKEGTGATKTVAHSSHTHTLNMDLAFIGVIIATKDA